MKKAIKLLLKDSVIYGFASSVQKLIPVFTIPIITAYLGKDALRLYDISFVYAMLVSWLVILGQDSSAATYYFDESKSADEKKQVLSYSFYIQVASMIVMLSGLYLFRSFLAELLFKGEKKLQHYWVFALSIIPGHVLLNYCLSILRWKLKSGMYMAICCINTIISIALVWYLVKFRNSGIDAVFYAYIISITLSAMTAVWFVRKTLFTNPFPLNKSLVIKLVTFGLPFALSSFFNQVIPAIDRSFLIHFHYSNEVLAEYGLAVRLGSFISLATGSFAMAFMPYALNIWNNKNAEEELSKIFRLVAAVFFLLIPISLLFKNVIIGFFADKSYAVSAQLLPFFFFGWVFDMFIYFGMLGIYKSRKAVPILVILSIGIVISVLLNIVLIPFWGVYGAATAFAVTKLLLFLINLEYSKKHFKIAITPAFFFSMLAGAVLVSYLAYLLPVWIYLLILMIGIIGLGFTFRKMTIVQNLLLRLSAQKPE